MKFLFTHCYSKQNRGDAAIVATMLRRFRRMFPSSHMTLATMDFIESGEKFESTPQVHSFFYLAIYTSRWVIMRAVKTFYIICASVVWACLFRVTHVRFNWLMSKQLLETLEAYTQADIVVPVGGGYLLGKNNLHDTLTVVLQLHAILIALILGKPVLLFSQSIGPFGNLLQNVAVRLVLNQVQIIMTRESLSTQNLKEIGVSRPRIVEAADAAFLFEPSIQTQGKLLLERFGVPIAKKIVGVTVRNWLPHLEQSAYEQAIADFVKELEAQHYTVLFVPQVSSTFHNDNDTLVQERIRKLLPVNTTGVYYLSASISFEEVKLVFAECAYVVGTRMHSVIFGLTSNVPALAIAYERKTLGIMSSFGLQQYAVPMEQVTSELLLQKFALLEKHSGEYIAKLQEHMPVVQARANAAFQEVERFVIEKGLV